MSDKNQNWSRDEHIVALDFYLRFRKQIPSKSSLEIQELSENLRQLQHSLGGKVSGTFRNVNGVYMKLMNFRRFDPEYSGKGLERGNKDEEIVWNLFSDHPAELKSIVEKILSYSENPEELSSVDYNEMEEAEEGRLLTRVHTYRERKTSIITKKKAQIQRSRGRLQCEACGFDFLETYGERGDGFIECHHTKPVSELNAGERTKLSDLVLLCSNCHRIVHRARPWLTLNELKDALSR